MTCCGQAARDDAAAVDCALERVRETRGRTLNLVRALSQPQLDFRPAADRWSVGEVLHHLILADGLGRKDLHELIELARSGRDPVLRRDLRGVDVSLFYLPKTFFALAELPLTIMNRFVTDEVRERVALARFIPVQNPEAATPERGRPGDELRRQLEQSFGETESLIRENADLEPGRFRRSDPLLGTADLAGMLRFQAAHERRHQKQICDVLTDESFPPETSP